MVVAGGVDYLMQYGRCDYYLTIWKVRELFDNMEGPKGEHRVLIWQYEEFLVRVVNYLTIWNRANYLTIWKVCWIIWQYGRCELFDNMEGVNYLTICHKVWIIWQYGRCELFDNMEGVNYLPIWKVIRWSAFI